MLAEMINKLFFLTLLPLNLLLLNAHNLPSVAQTNQPQTKQTGICDGALSTIKRTIQGDRGIDVKVDRINLSDRYRGYPVQRPEGYAVTMIRGQRASDVMASPQFMKTLSASLISSCSTVSLVKFGVIQTDWHKDFGLMAAGQVEQFACIKPRSGIPAWGSTVCL
jgi:hypothetical protein